MLPQWHKIIWLYILNVPNLSKRNKNVNAVVAYPNYDAIIMQYEYVIVNLFHFSVRTYI